VPIDVNPIIAHVGPLVLSWQGFFTGVGLFVALWLATTHLRQHGVDPASLYDATLWAVPASILGARVFHVVDNWNYYAMHPLDVVAITRGGAAVYGSVVFGSIAGLLFCRQRGLPIGTFFDAIAPAQALGLAIGRVGDLLTGGSLGRPTTLPFAVAYVNPASFDPRHALVHPAAAYLIAWDLAVFALLIWFRRQRLRPGVSFWSFSALFAVGQFGDGFFRVEPLDAYGLDQAQIVGAILLLLSVIALLAIATGVGVATARTAQVTSWRSPDVTGAPGLGTGRD